MKNTLLLICLIVFVSGCRKEPSSENSYAKEMAGIWYWQGIIEHHRWESFPPHYEIDTASYLDTTYITYINDTTIYVKGTSRGIYARPSYDDTLIYDNHTSDESSGIVVFFGLTQLPRGFHQLTYFSKENKITDTSWVNYTVNSTYYYGSTL